MECTKAALAACNMYESILVVQRSSVQKNRPLRWWVVKREFASSAGAAEYTDLFELPDKQAALDVCTLDGVEASWLPFGKKKS